MKDIMLVVVILATAAMRLCDHLLSSVPDCVLGSIVYFFHNTLCNTL